MNEELKVVLRSIWPVLLVLVGIPLLSYGIWMVWPSRTLNVLIVDKTVPFDNYREHTGIMWALNHEKFKLSSGKAYRVNEDYLGFFPSGKESFGEVRDFSQKTSEQIRSEVSKQDVVFFADTYGVYESDFFKNEDFRPEKKIYGGLDASDIELVKSARLEGKTLIAEFNTMASPTSEGMKAEFENQMGIKWTGWIGRFFEELDTLESSDVPKWLVTNYRAANENWSFSGPGLVFVKNTGEIEVFQYQRDFASKLPLIRTQKVNKHGFSLPQVVPYPDWFDVIMIERDYQVISYYDINPTVVGLQRLKAMGLPRFFPAAVFRKVDEGEQFYFAGDFSDMENGLGTPGFAGLPFLWRGLYVAADHRNRQSFYWNYYYPLISQIFDRMHQKQK